MQVSPNFEEQAEFLERTSRGLKKNSIPFRLLKLETTEHINHVQHVHFINKKTRGTEM